MQLKWNFVCVQTLWQMYGYYLLFISITAKTTSNNPFMPKLPKYHTIFMYARMIAIKSRISTSANMHVKTLDSHFLIENQ